VITMSRRGTKIVAVLLGLSAALSLASAETGASRSGLRAGLLHIRQTGPTSDPSIIPIKAG